MVETEAVVLRTLKYGEADAILTLLTPGMGRISAIAKGARKATSKQGGRLQPGVRLHLSAFEGRGDLLTVRSTQVIDAGSGLWMDGYRLRAASSVLETAMRVVHEHEEAEAAYNLVTRALALIARTDARKTSPRLDPYVLSMQVKLLAVTGLVPQLGSCAACSGPPPLVAFSPAAGGGVCAGCVVSAGGEHLDPAAADAVVALLASPLTDAPDVVSDAAALGVERLAALMFREHLGVVLKSGTPL